jgi:hypothetical protein
MSKALDQGVFPDFVRALAFASRKHSQQRRKDADASPYINHPIALVSILAVEAGINDRDLFWVGAGTKDTGFSLTRFTFQITHATDSDTNSERDYIIAELRKNRVIDDVRSYQAGQHLPTERVNHYITDGEVTVASLARQ